MNLKKAKRVIDSALSEAKSILSGLEADGKGDSDYAQALQSKISRLSAEESEVATKTRKPSKLRRSLWNSAKYKNCSWSSCYLFYTRYSS